MSLDDKSECIGIYLKGELLMHGKVPDNLDRTWKYLPHLRGKDIEYAQLYCTGQTLKEVCPPSLSKEWERLTGKLQAYLTSFAEAKINLNEVCFYDLVPVQFLKEFFDMKCKITDSVFETFKKPSDYRYRLKLEELLGDIRGRRLIIESGVLSKQRHKPRVRGFLKKLETVRKNVDYNQFGSKTGRLTTAPNTFPILTMDAAYRAIVKPSKGWFVEFDYNAAELRTLLALNELEQPEGDIHKWNMEQTGAASREAVKKDVFAWLYGSTVVDNSKFDSLYDTKKIREKFWDGYEVTNYFNRKIKADSYHSLNYIIQSTTSDLVLRQAIKVHDFLKGKKAHIAFIIHDSIILDFSYEEKSNIKEVRDIFSFTELGNFKTSVKIGKGLDKMTEVEV